MPPTAAADLFSDDRQSRIVTGRGVTLGHAMLGWR